MQTKASIRRAVGAFNHAAIQLVPISGRDWVTAMNLENNTSLVLDPQQLALLFTAFDAAWEQCAADYNGSTSVEAARLCLANAVLAAYQSGVRETPMITAAAVRTMALRRPRLSSVFYAYAS